MGDWKCTVICEFICRAHFVLSHQWKDILTRPYGKVPICVVVLLWYWYHFLPLIKGKIHHTVPLNSLLHPPCSVFMLHTCVLYPYYHSLTHVHHTCYISSSSVKFSQCFEFIPIRCWLHLTSCFLRPPHTHSSLLNVHMGAGEERCYAKASSRLW